MPTRQEILDQVYAALTAVTSISATTFFGNHDLGAGTPVCTYYTESDARRGDMSDMGGDINELVLNVELREKTNTGLSDTIDDLVAEVANKVENTAAINSYLVENEYVSVDFDYDNEGDENVVVATLAFNMLYEPNETYVPTINFDNIYIIGTNLYGTVSADYPCKFYANWNRNGGLNSGSSSNDTYVDQVTFVWNAEYITSGDTLGITVLGEDANGTFSSIITGEIVSGT